MPDFALEREAGGLVAGIDEVGRGPWAGPVVAVAAVLDPATLSPALVTGIADSKTLSRRRREQLFALLCREARLGLGAASAAEIDRHNILGATLLAMTRALGALGTTPDLALVDGNRAPDLACPVRTVVGGDGRSLSIAAASIVAKVMRDRMMAALGDRFPAFGWDHNAGYGTAQHRQALERLGPTPLHRRSFAPVARLID